MTFISIIMPENILSKLSVSQTQTDKNQQVSNCKHFKRQLFLPLLHRTHIYW